MSLSGSIQRNRRWVSDAVPRFCKGDLPGQNIFTLSSTQAFLCFFAQTADATTFRQIWRTQRWGGAVRTRWALQKNSLTAVGVFLSCQHLSQRRWQEKEVKWKQSEVSSLETAKITFRNIYWGPEAVSSHCVATCPSNPFFIPVTSVASMDPTLEEFRLAIKYSSPTWDSTSHFLGHKVVMSVK